MTDRSTSALFLDDAVGPEQIVDRRSRWKRPTRFALAQLDQQLLGTPARMPMTKLQQCIDHRLFRAVRNAQWRSPSLLQSRRTFLKEPFDPLVARLSADPVSFAQLAERVDLAQVIRDELGLLMHGCRLAPGHADHSSCDPQMMGIWYPCTWTFLLPMCPDRTKVPPNTWLQPTARNLVASLPAFRVPSLRSAAAEP